MAVAVVRSMFCWRPGTEGKRSEGKKTPREGEGAKEKIDSIVLIFIQPFNR